MTRLKGFDLLALGFMTFALFLGAGNIIFPPSAGMEAGHNIGLASLGFLITAVGLPLATVVALARVGGGMPALTSPLGKASGLALAVAVYLTIGPLFATPRTAVVSFEIGLVPFVGKEPLYLFLYTLVYFAAVLALVLVPGRLIDNVGKLITPVLLIALAVLGGSALLLPQGNIGAASGEYVNEPLLAGFIAGYQTMDALGALVFGIVIATAIRSRGISEASLITRYSVIAALIAALCLGLVYISLFYLGASSQELAAGATNGGQILTRYVHNAFGPWGNFLLGLVIVLACMTTAVGLIAACGEFFSGLLGWSYRLLVCLFAGGSLLVANVGLEQLIRFSIPVLVGLYPLAIALVAVSLADRLWVSTRRVMVPVMAVTLIFAVADGLRAAGIADAHHWLLGQTEQGGGLHGLLSGLGNGLDWLYTSMPFASAGLAWLVPALVVLVLAVIYDRLAGPPSEVVA